MTQFGEALKQDEADVDAYSKRAHLFAQAAEFSNAIRDLSKAIEVIHAGSTTNSVSVSALYVRKGIVHFCAAEVDLAIADYTAALQFDSNNWEALFHRWQAHRFVGANKAAEKDRLEGMKLKSEVFSIEYSFDDGVF